MELYKALIAAGVKEDLAEAAAEAVITRKEALEILLTKAEFHEALARSQNSQTTTVVAVIGALIGVLTLLVSLT